MRQPFRTLLILQGVIWGTALGVFPPAILKGTFRKAEWDASAQGTNRIVLALEHLEVAESFSWKDVSWIRENYQAEIDHISGFAMVKPDTKQGQWILATDTAAMASRAMKVSSGRFISTEELNSASKVCVLEHKLARKLFGNESPLGQSFQNQDGIEFEIIGVASLESGVGENLDEFGYESGHPMSRWIQELKRNIGVVDDDQVKQLKTGLNVMVPFTVFPEISPNIIEIRAEPNRVMNLRDRLKTDLIETGYQPVIYTNALLPFLYGQTLDTFIELNRIVFLLCVIVGTCVVCVLMVLSVVERQREIAIRRVEGARQWHIAFQFIVETGTLCAVGSVMGVPLGLGLAAIRCALEPLASVDWMFPPFESFLIVAIVTGIGLVGGCLPAWRAVRSDPVEILRYE